MNLKMICNLNNKNNLKKKQDKGSTLFRVTSQHFKHLHQREGCKTKGNLM